MSETRITIAVVFALCLCTCTVPLFSISPAALGKTELSALDIVTLAPASQGLLTNIVRLVWAVYLLIAGGLLLLLLPRYIKPVFVCTAFALGITSRVLQMRYSYGLLSILKKQTGWHDGAISLNPEAYALPVLLVFILLVLSIGSKLDHRET